MADSPAPDLHRLSRETIERLHRSTFELQQQVGHSRERLAETRASIEVLRYLAVWRDRVESPE